MPLSQHRFQRSGEDEVERSFAERRQDMAEGLGLSGVASYQERTSSLAEKLLMLEMDQNKDLLDY
jgi:heme-degrading monooxygenase HmoA